MIRYALTLGIFALALALVIIKPRGHSEAWWTALGGGALLGLRLVTPSESLAIVVTSKSALLFLLALLLLSALVERSGFFAWAAIKAARLAKGDAKALYRNVFLLGSAVTIALSLDTTAVLLTPLVLGFVQRLRLPARPYILACAFIANTASLALPISNLTNLLLASDLHLGFGAFAARMALPQLVAIACTYALMAWWFRRELPPRFDEEALEDPDSAIPHRGYFRAATSVLVLVLFGYFLAPFARFEAYEVAFAGALVLAVCGVATRRVEIATIRGVPWALFPFVIGLFVLVKGVENLGIGELASTWLARAPEIAPLRVLIGASTLTVASNAANNLPAALFARSVLASARADHPLVYGALLGTNIGPNIVPSGSLATMLVLSVARRKGEKTNGLEFFKAGIWMTPLVLLAASLALIATFYLWP